MRVQELLNTARSRRDLLIRTLVFALAPCVPAVASAATLNLALPAHFTPATRAPDPVSFRPAATESMPPPTGITPGERRFRTRVLMWSGISAEVLYGVRSWWNTGFSSTFRTSNEGWFGQDTYTGGADKLGHFYSAYVGSRLLALGYHRWAGNGRAWSIRAGALTAFATLTTVEVMDGFSKHYRFSKEDAIMNGAGAALGALMEQYPHLDKVLAFRMRYLPSRYSTFNPVDDYSGQTYLLALKASGIPRLRNIPVVRYLEFDVGYGTRDYESHDPALHRRYIYVGLSLNLSQLLDDTLFSGRYGGGATQEFADTFLRYVQMPGTALLHRRPLSQ